MRVQKLILCTRMQTAQPCIKGRYLKDKQSGSGKRDNSLLLLFPFKKKMMEGPADIDSPGTHALAHVGRLGRLDR